MAFVIFSFLAGEDTRGMKAVGIGLLVGVSLLGQSPVLPILECVDTVTKGGTSSVAASVLAGSTTVSFTQPIPVGLAAVLNPGGANQETVLVSLYTTSNAPYSATLLASSALGISGSLTFAHSAGEPVTFESQESAAYYGFFNVYGPEVTNVAGGATNFFTPGNADLGQRSTFPPGVFRNHFGVPIPYGRDQVWILGSLPAVARRVPEFACGNPMPQIQAESVSVAQGTATAGLRLGTVTGGAPGALTVKVPLVFRRSTFSAPAPTSDVHFSNLRVQNGVIFGDVTAGAAVHRHFFFILDVTDSAGGRGLRTGVADVVNPCAMTVTPPVLSNAYVNTPYSVNFSASGGPGPITFAMEGTLPVGLAMTAGGVLSGTPVQTGSFPLTLRSMGGDGCFQRTAMTLEVQGQLCAANVTPLVEITLGGFRQNLVTRRWQQTVTLRNGGQSSIFGPVALVVDNLSANAAMANSGGATACAAPLGRPYVVAGLGPNNLLAPGATVAIALEFTNSSTAPITYTPRVIAGGAIR